MPASTFRLQQHSFAYHLSRGDWLPTVVAEAAVDLPRTSDAPSLARATLQREVDGLLADHEREILEVLVTELVTNAVEHAGREAGESVVLHFAVAPERVRVEVCDEGSGFTVSDLSRPRSEPGGYGLLLVDRGASRWGSSREDGNCVWFELDRNASRPQG